jgi:hypothetical protein
MHKNLDRYHSIQYRPCQLRLTNRTESLVCKRTTQGERQLPNACRSHSFVHAWIDTIYIQVVALVAPKAIPIRIRIPGPVPISQIHFMLRIQFSLPAGRIEVLPSIMQAIKIPTPKRKSICRVSIHPSVESSQLGK